ncbi:hypothetical protein TNCV_1127261 [Trichonephila clavipes]|nr:hypothetical protein TNCV_1127261 [Trichonephila clavipes]
MDAREKRESKGRTGLFSTNLSVPLANSSRAFQLTLGHSRRSRRDEQLRFNSHVLTTNQDSLTETGPSTSGHIDNLDMGWRNAARSISQRHPA